MWRVIFALLFYFQNGSCNLWPKGVVHFSINAKDYDIHSQDEILSTLEAIEHEICVKFFSIPTDFNSTDKRILYITNPAKLKDCPPQSYDHSKAVVDMAIGYKCINKKSIARIVVDMLRSSIENNETPMNSFDLVRKFQEEKEDPSRPFLISPTDRNFINHNYHAECRSPSGHSSLTARRSGAVSLSDENKQYYKNRLWPLGIVMYGAEEDIAYSAPYLRLKNAMTSIELVSCVVFQELKQIDALKPKNLLWFSKNGAEAPALGFKQGNQTISLLSMVDGAPGHTAHTLSLLLRALGVPMTSNRPDRDNHVTVHWNHVEKGKEHYLEQIPMSAWVRDARLPYDFDSATHAPANYVCRDCNSGQMTVEPAHDNLWKRALSMGHRNDLSEGDKAMLDILYSAPCRDRYNSNQ